MKDSPSKQIRSVRKAVESAGGFALRATGRGALVLQTENARRMMRRVSRLGSAPDQALDDGRPPAATPTR